MVKCPACSTDITESSRFCPTCGRAVEPQTAFATKTVASSSSQSTPQKRASRPSTAPAISSTSSDDTRFLPGAVLADRYRIIALLGKGGMGEVYRADDLTLGQQVALKFLPESLVDNPDSLTRFRNEVRVARQVSHPNVCRVYDVGEVDGHFFLSMEYVDGEDLASLLRRIGRLPVDKALEISRRLCAGLAAAHEKGVLHRDLKPSNIMLDGRGHVLLTDFGLAALTGEITANEIRSGTPAYMSPEQLAGKEVTVRSDVYALGLVLYELFTGKRPFEASSLAELARARTQTTPVSLTTLVRDLDPMVERAIMRCLDPEPSRRPSSALAVAAALPGGDPLAAALAAGETPSPEMVVAAGEGAGLSPMIAIPVFIAIIVGIVLVAVLLNRSSALEMIRPEFSSEVLSQKTRDIIQRIGYTSDAADHAYGFDWDGTYVDYVKDKDKPGSRWPEVLGHGPSPLRFWYRQSPYPLIDDTFHSDLLTPGIVDFDSPPPILSGMVGLQLDSRGLLTRFEAMPAQRQETGKQAAELVDWNPMFAAAGLDVAQFKPAEPLWTFLSASDSRFAWLGTWPGTTRPLRVEAAALRGKPVAFSLIGPWRKPERMPPQNPGGQTEIFFIVVSILAVVICVGAGLLARGNLLKGRGDRDGAFRLAAGMFTVLMWVWICQQHLVLSIGIFGMFFLALCTSIFYGVIMWTVYIALEPYVRRHWPHTLIGWTSLLSGRARDPVVGRDVLFGVALGVCITLMLESLNAWRMPRPDWVPDMVTTDVLLGTRAAAAVWLTSLAQDTRTVLFFFFFLFLLRVLLRNQWLAAAVWVLLFAAVNILGNGNNLILWIVSLLFFGLEAFVVLRWGLLSMALGMLVHTLLVRVPGTAHFHAWYFGNSVFMLASVVALAAWGFSTSMAGRRLWKKDLFD